MVGIILASHGSFADGIFQSGQMIFGEQENVAHVTLMPSEGPDDIRAKMEEAVASFENQDEVWFLVDLWGGPPFNQANNLVEQHTDKWAIVLARVDSRLLHGQVATAWTKTTQPTRIIVVSDGVAHDKLRKNLITEAAPPGVKANVIPIDKMIEVAKDPRFGNTKALLLFETPEDALKAIEGGVDIKELNIGSMAHSVGKVAVNKVLSLGKEDVETFDKLKEIGVKFDVRKVPTDSHDNMDEIVDKARKELGM